jgi:hypothetical protein
LGEQHFIDDLIRKFGEHLEFFTDSSRSDATDAEGAEDLSQACREAIEATSVTIVVIGRQTGCRKFVDWELWYTLQKKHGLLAISRPDLDDSSICLPERLVDNGKSGYAKWYPYPGIEHVLRLRIEEACDADKNRIDNSRVRMKKSTSCCF